ncbi:MAG: transcriptional repressor [Candidatus Marinimicrobia bacterium]|jgi:Fe2+ or Zn2+ uptake regulation protein|nr:transcriptional repressor [Candidatus Neomarinimicrobiota bacterium]MBT3631991.1 transcriptional repressor [Candidatus Neomarinimicrobiota bacterium]MBT3824577.1 transcriptional repressor [Candidatus Neomarinimicrobiota bacterium]MBT4130248.1 transcriptional repressor [Candidatus Neomarinimicrobiota bacterium]MBT4296999.1 transcriptional repressor [Candidatus Neomarinimicrobiota bacterium]
MEPIKQRYSKQRETILQVVQSTLVHPNADWIYNETRKIISNISLGTVYRNLNQLVESGRIIKLKDEAMVRYDGNVRQHDHFRCSVCGKWYDVEMIDQSIIQSFAEKHDFRIESFNLELEGTCKSCLDS